MPSMHLISSCVAIAVRPNGVIALVTGPFFSFKLPPIKQPLMNGGVVCVCVLFYAGQARNTVVAGSQLQRHRPVRLAG